jgi:hypothetical protein
MIMSSEGENRIREVNIDTFLQKCNYELVCSDPNFCLAMGIKSGNNDDAQKLGLSPEELAK